MLGSAALDLVVILVLGFLLFSLVCSSLTEATAWALGWRGRMLFKGLQRFFHDKTGEWTRAVYGHHQIAGLWPSLNPWRIYHIPTQRFVIALQEVANERPDLLTPGSDTKKIVDWLVGDHPNTTDVPQERITQWFEDSVGIIRQRYRHRVVLTIVAFALLLLPLCNADAYMVFRAVWTDAAVRQGAAAGAAKVVERSQPEDRDAVAEALAKVQQQVSKIRPLGWNLQVSEMEDRRGVPDEWQSWLAKVLGLLVSLMAVTAGAPFWYDLFRKLVSYRSDPRALVDDDLADGTSKRIRSI